MQAPQSGRRRVGGVRILQRPSLRTPNADIWDAKRKGWHEATPSVGSTKGCLEVVLGCELHPAIARLGRGDTGGARVVIEDRIGAGAGAVELQRFVGVAVLTEYPVRVVEPVG